MVNEIGSLIARKTIRIRNDIHSTVISGNGAVPDDPSTSETEIFLCLSH